MANRKTEGAEAGDDRPLRDEAGEGEPAAGAAVPDPSPAESAPSSLTEPAPQTYPTPDGSFSARVEALPDHELPDPAQSEPASAPLAGVQTQALPDRELPDPAQSEPASAPLAGVHTQVHAPEAERRSSFAARALGFLLVLIAGAALGVWAAPKVAPMLPAGLAPVAEWLTPDQSETQTRLTALEAALADVGAQVASVPSVEDVETRAQALVGAAQADLSGQIAGLRDTFEQSDVTQASERIGRLETSLQGATTELGSLRDQIAAGAASGEADAATAASIDTYRAELDGLRAEVGELSGSVSGLGARLDEVAASAEARVVAAQAESETVQQAAVAERDLAAAQADIALIRAALASGAPFAEPLANLASAAAITPPAGLDAAAATGVQTLPALRAAFADAAHEAIRAGIVAGAGDGVVARSQAFLQAQVASRSLTPQAGASPDAVLSRMEDALRRDDLGAAMTEADQLPAEAAAAMEPWLAAAKLRTDAEAGLAEVSASVATLN